FVIKMNSQFAMKLEGGLSSIETDPLNLKVEIKSEVEEEICNDDITYETFSSAPVLALVETKLE
ncbi:hypothetical protein L9F63_022173, partial [Diploptera punctata]